MRYRIYPRRDGFFNLVVYLGAGETETFYALTSQQLDDMTRCITENINI